MVGLSWEGGGETLVEGLMGFSDFDFTSVLIILFFGETYSVLFCFLGRLNDLNDF